MDKNLVCFGLGLNDSLKFFGTTTGLKEKLSIAIQFKNKGGLEDVSAVISEQFSKFTFSNKLSDFISEAPPLSAPFGRYNLSNATEFILQQIIGIHITSKPIIAYFIIFYS